MDCEKRKNFIIDFAFAAIVLAMFYVLLKYGINFLMPFLIALLVAIFLKPAVKFLNEKLKINHKISAVILVILFYGIIGTGIVLLVIQLGVFLKDIILNFQIIQIIYCVQYLEQIISIMIVSKYFIQEKINFRILIYMIML